MPTRRMTMTEATETAPIDKAMATVAGADARMPAKPSPSGGSGLPGGLVEPGGGVAEETGGGGADEVMGAEGKPVDDGSGSTAGGSTSSIDCTTESTGSSPPGPVFTLVVWVVGVSVGGAEGRPDGCAVGVTD